MIRRKRFCKRVGNRKQYESYISRTTRTVSSGDDPKDIIDLFNKIQADHESDPITPFEEFATDILNKAGLEPTFLGDTVVAVKDKTHEPEWYAVKILEYAWRTRKAIKEGNAEWAAKCGMDLSTAYHYMFIHNIESAARSGEKQIDDGGLSRKYSEEDKANWLKTAIELKKKKPKMFNSDIIRAIARETGHGESAIKLHLRNTQK